jgi:hypothetical protein
MGMNESVALGARSRASSLLTCRTELRRSGIAYIQDMRNRQVHLDFHTSEKIPGVGSAFDAHQFQRMLKLGHVDSITIFAKCHHGWHYHPTAAGRQHPTLNFDLLKAQIAAAKEIGVKTPVYISAGLDEQTYWRNPGWARREANGSVPWAGSNDKAGFHELCMNTPYLDQLAAQVEETGRLYGEDGLFLDIVGLRPCWCCTCVSERLAEGDPADKKLIDQQSRRVYLNYARRVRQALDKGRAGARIFHNNGHITRGDMEIARQNTHLELESLPTGGWGYDHFPLSAGYARTTGMEFLGMTGKFHLSWGEFGGFKHPNALRYEAAAAIAQGAAVSVGDQLHPDGAMEEATYAMIGAAYAEVEAKEPWIAGARSLAEVALLSHEAVGLGGAHPFGSQGGIDEGAVRMLLEGHVWFDVVDRAADWSRYKLLVLPDAIRPDAALAAKLLAFAKAGGRVIATGASGLKADSDQQIFDFGADDAGLSTFDPEYLVPLQAIAPWPKTAFVVYGSGRVLKLRGGTVHVERSEPFFNRALGSFCSHAHTPNKRGTASPAVVSGAHGTWIAHPLCKLYLDKGQQILRDVFMTALTRELPLQVESSLPSQARLTLMRQDAHKRDVLHLLFATPIKRGHGVEVIEELIPLADVRVAVRRAAKPSRVSLAPQSTALPFTYEGGRVRFTVPKLTCHQMVVLED